MARAESEKEPTPVAELFPPQGEWTEEDYFSLPETNRYVELSEGRLLMPLHLTYRHQRALLAPYARLGTFIEENDLGEVLIAPLPVRLWPGKICKPVISSSSPPRSIPTGSASESVASQISWSRSPRRPSSGKGIG